MNTNAKKRSLILSAKVLAEIPSRIPPPSAISWLFWPLLIIFTVAAWIVASISTGEKAIMWIGGVTGVILGTVLLMVIRRVFARRFPLTFTERGITAGPFINELWEDLGAYRLYEVHGLRRHTVSRITLILFNKGFWHRTTGMYGSIFPIQGYFFTEEQQAVLKRIFSDKGINERL